MPVSTRKNKDALGTNFDQRTFDEAVNADGPHQVVTQLAKTDGVRIDPAQDGVDGTGITPPTGAAGLRGWLSGIFSKFTRLNDGTVTAAGKDHLTVGGSDGTNLRPIKTNTAGNILVDASGTLITGYTMPAGGVGMAGHLSAIADAVRGTPSSLSDTTRVPIDERDGLVVTGALSAAGVLFNQDMTGYQSISVQVTSAGTGCTISWEISNNNTNFDPIGGTRSTSTGEAPGELTNANLAGTWNFSRRSKWFRARISTYGSGTVNVTAILSKANINNIINAVSLAAGETHIGEVGGKTALPTATFTRPADTTAYASGDLVANSTTAGSVTPMSFSMARATGKGGMVRRARITKTGTSVTNALLRLHLYKASPTPVNGDNSSWSTDQSANYIGALDVTVDKAFTDGATGGGTPNTGSEINYTSDTYYGLLEARAAYTPASAEQFTVELEALQN